MRKIEILQPGSTVALWHNQGNTDIHEVFVCRRLFFCYFSFAAKRKVRKAEIRTEAKYLLMQLWVSRQKESKFKLDNKSQQNSPFKGRGVSLNVKSPFSTCGEGAGGEVISR